MNRDLYQLIDLVISRDFKNQISVTFILYDYITKMIRRFFWCLL